MQQYAAILFFIMHPFWITFAHKNIPIPKFEAQWNHLIKKNPNAVHLTPYAACMQQYAANFFFVKHSFWINYAYKTIPVPEFLIE